MTALLAWRVLPYLLGLAAALLLAYRESHRETEPWTRDDESVKKQQAALEAFGRIAERKQ